MFISEVLFDEEELFPDDALSNHIDMVDNEPAVNEARRQFMRYLLHTSVARLYGFKGIFHFIAVILL